MINNPCKNCPDRHMHCALNCPKWDGYVKKRNEIYAHRVQNWGIKSYEVEKMYRKKYGNWRNREKENIL